MISIQDLPDPLLKAGYRRCRECRRAAFPVDAIWLDAGGQVLASYPASCAHQRAAVVVLNVAAGTETAAKYPDPELYLAGRRCAARNRHHRNCGSFAAAGSAFCHRHQLETA
jgi:hypothetical protein